MHDYRRLQKFCCLLITEPDNDCAWREIINYLHLIWRDHHGDLKSTTDQWPCRVSKIIFNLQEVFAFCNVVLPTSSSRQIKLHLIDLWVHAAIKHRREDMTNQISLGIVHRSNVVERCPKMRCILYMLCSYICVGGAHARCQSRKKGGRINIYASYVVLLLYSVHYDKNWKIIYLVGESNYWKRVTTRNVVITRWLRAE